MRGVEVAIAKVTLLYRLGNETMIAIAPGEIDTVARIVFPHSSDQNMLIAKAQKLGHFPD